jgi:hypothetical protein
MALFTDGVNRLTFISFLIAYLSQMFNYAYAGNMMLDASAKVNVAAYDVHWYKCDKDVRRLVLLMMIRSQRLVNVKVPFLEMSLETFEWVGLNTDSSSKWTMTNCSILLSSDRSSRLLMLHPCHGILVKT